MNDNLYQLLVVTLSDGRVGTFMGKALVSEEDIKNGVRADFEFIKAKPLPDDCKFELLGEE